MLKAGKKLWYETGLLYYERCFFVIGQPEAPLHFKNRLFAYLVALLATMLPATAAPALP
jgi:hypothetical protein